MTKNRWVAASGRRGPAMPGNPSRGRLAGPLIAALAVLVIHAAPALAAPGDTTLVSRADGPSGANSNEDAADSTISADGNLVAFATFSTNMHPDVPGFTQNVYVRNVATDTTVLASRPTGTTGAGDNHSYDATIAGGGRYVAFGSFATNLDPDDTAGFPSVFLRDLQTGETSLVSRADGADGADANNTADDVEITADGRYVAFMSWATNLDPADSSTDGDIYVRDTATDETILVSRADGAAGASANDDCDSPSISDNGRYVAFDCDATNLDPGDSDATEDVYVRDLVDNETTLISRGDGVGGEKGNGDSESASISADGSIVAYESESTNLHPADSDATDDVYLRTGVTTELVSAVGSGSANDEAEDPAISADGSRIAFASIATNLSAADNDALEDVFVTDVGSGEHQLLSRAQGVAGAKGDADSSDPELSADGGEASFTSAADNLDPDDSDDGRADVYVRGAIPTTVPDPGPGPSPACSDGADNDGDGKIDFPADPGCSSAADTDEANGPAVDTSACDKAKKKLKKAKKKFKKTKKKTGKAKGKLKKAKKAGDGKKIDKAKKKLKQAKKKKQKAKKKKKKAKQRVKTACA